METNSPTLCNFVHANPKSQEKSDPCGAGLEKGRDSFDCLSLSMAAETQGRNEQECGCQQAKQQISGTGGLCYCSCNLTGKGGSTSLQSRTFQGWPAGHATLTILCTQVSLPCKSKDTGESSLGAHTPQLISHLESQGPSNACVSVSLAPFQNLGRSLSNLATKPRTSTATS
jgi:hypothetical protein